MDAKWVYMLKTDAHGDVVKAKDTCSERVKSAMGN